MISGTHRRTRDEGFTLVEVMVVVSIMSTLLAFGVGSWRAWALGAAHSGTANSVQSTLRNAQVRAVTEGISFCVRFDPATDTYGLFRYACNDSPELVKGPFRVEDPRVRIQAPQFTTPDATLASGVTFRPSGSAWPGQVQVTRAGSTKVYVLKVEGFTGRVSLS